MKKLSFNDLEKIVWDFFEGDVKNYNEWKRENAYANEKRFVDFKELEPKLNEILPFLACSGFQTIKGYRECEYYWNKAESNYCSTCKASIKLKELLEE